MARFAALRELLESTVLRGPASVPASDRQRAATAPDALDGPRGRYCAQVASDATGVTDADVAAMRAQGLGDVEIFEYTVAAAVGRARQQLDAALAALGAAGDR
jgi:hypothetical protein